MRITRLAGVIAASAGLALVLVSCSPPAGLRFEADGSTLCSGMGGPTIFGTSLTNDSAGAITLAGVSFREVSNVTIDEIAVAPRPENAEDPTGLVFTDAVPATYLDNWTDRVDPAGFELQPGATIDIFVMASESGSPGSGLMRGLEVTPEGTDALPARGLISFGFSNGRGCAADES